MLEQQEAHYCELPAKEKNKYCWITNYRVGFHINFKYEQAYELSKIVQTWMPRNYLMKKTDCSVKGEDTVS